MLGPEACQRCHTAEHQVWEGTKHHSSFRDIHRNRAARGILQAVGDRRMQQSDTCAMCHYTVVDGSADAGPSCESCHGPAQDWIEVHNDKNNPTAIQDAIGKGMIHSSMIYDIAANCMSCHGLANENLPGDVAAAMLGADHPANVEYELVAYSQGTVRHRFYPPEVTVNQELTEAEKSVYYLVGQAAALVSATAAMAKTDDAKYVEFQQARAAKARDALQTVAGAVPEAQALLDSPSEQAGRAFAEAIKGNDYTGQVGDRLPSEYK